MRQTQQQTHIDKGARRRMRLLGIVVLGFLAWAGMTIMKQEEFVSAKMSQVADLEQKLAEAKTVNEKLKLEFTRLNDPEYIEQKAKKDQQMIRDGETLFTEPESSE
jgi:cell division protein DivIC